MSLETDIPESCGTIFAIPPAQPGDASLMKIAEVARIIARPGEPEHLVAQKLRHQLHAGTIVPVAREEGPTGAHLFDLGGAALAAIHIRLCEAGVRSTDALQAVTLAATAWTRADLTALMASGRPSPSPINQVVKHILEGETSFGLQLRTLAPIEGGPIRYAARFYSAQRRESTSWHFDLSNYVLRAVISIDVAAIVAEALERRLAVA